MALDFPTSPSVGQKYPASPIAGVPTYSWDGEKWTTIGGAVMGANAVCYDIVQSLTAPQQQQARQNINAAPFDAMAYGGMQINGTMEISQWNGTTLVPLNNVAGYALDGFGTAMLGAGVTSNVGQIAITSLPGFSYCLIFQATATNPLAASLDGQWVYQPIEGYRWARLCFGTANAQPVTVSFWVFPNITGTMAVSVRSSDSAHSYVVDVPVTAGIWQYKTVTIPGDTTGTWTAGNALGATISFCFGAGSGRKGASANTWLAANVIASPATTNFFAAPGTIYLTGVIVLPGNEAPSAARSPFVMRPYDQELMLCRRYFYNGVPALVGVATATTAASRFVNRHPVQMRAAPTITITTALPVFDGTTPTTVTSVGTNYSTTDLLSFDGVTSGLTVGRPAVVYLGAGGNLNVDARL